MECNLISVVVLTYNSSKTVIETLNSIVNQTYDTKAIELIISDDASNDMTINVMGSWLKEHELKFNSVVKIYHQVNLGIVSNLDNAYRKASGAWIKTIAGDDILTPECLHIYAKASQDSEGRVFLSYLQTFYEDKGALIKKGILPPSNQVKLLRDCNLERQKSFLINSSFSATPSLFIEKKLLDEVGYLDKSYFLMEDYPLWISITNFGEKIYFVPEITVLYRVQESVSRSKERIVNMIFLSDIMKLEKTIISNLSVFSLSFFRRNIWMILYPRTVLFFKNKRHFISKGFLLAIHILFKPGYLSGLLNRYFKLLLNATEQRKGT